MSHAAAGAAIKAEPNLIPLLDVVMQLLMFFMMCVHFVNEQFTQNIELPVAQSARPPEQADQSDVLVLNLNSQGYLEVGEGRPLETLQDMGRFLRREYEHRLILAEGRSGEKEVKTAVVIRADKNVEFETVFRLLEKCKEIGFRRLQLRAMTKA